MIKDIDFTKKAVEKINMLVSKKNPGTFFRIAVKGGGCSGFKYDFSFDQTKQKNDHIFDKAIIDNESLKIIEGSIIDYKKEMIGNSFVILNPKASSSCGCGMSFSV